ncbi:hypothetical protein CHGG_04063 [Chaetomium globosum CBS 148.51]|uniref:Cytochrome P450 n=1 Tax=Chaetomium globosum (strain ATCC 6205 / CBS 148.51 / DSM 1962 / NBRC 6347 / NRRL 1970) TaxID=306901 RepID=Q2H2D3_CHAGB|nr:uncharacterized protein CHGG_04063 [Chaetomium globosum CBS 148.51]EAQ87444.1 hypothetical protein CHGG_04063 [Chaetomium globosum CBS 148.51]
MASTTSSAMADVTEVLLSPTFLVTAALLVAGNVIFFLSSYVRRPRHFPPGPPGLPGLGNLFQINKSIPALTYTAWAHKYGQDKPMGVKLGATNIVVLNSARMVRDLFERRGAIYSDRPRPNGEDEKWKYQTHQVPAALFHDNGPWLTRWRREFNGALGSAAAVARLNPMNDAETARALVALLEAGPTTSGPDLEEIILAWVTSVPCISVVGQRPDAMAHHGFDVKAFRSRTAGYMVLHKASLMDRIPILRHLPGKFGMAAWRAESRVVAKGFPEVQQRIREEVLQVSGGAPLKAADVPRLAYTEAFWHEGIPHAPAQDDEYDGFQIPKHTAVYANVWHIHHSPEDYASPEKFEPERFLRHPFGMRPGAAHDPTTMDASSSSTAAANARATFAFGFGRRVCPGMLLAKQSLILGLAKVLWAFEVLPAEGGGELDMDVETGFVQGLITFHPKKLDVSLRLREGRSRQDILDHYAEAYQVEAEVMGW